MIWKMVILGMRGQVRNNMISSLCTFEFWCVCVEIYALENAVVHCSLWTLQTMNFLYTYIHTYLFEHSMPCCVLYGKFVLWTVLFCIAMCVCVCVDCTNHIFPVYTTWNAQLTVGVKLSYEVLFLYVNCMCFLSPPSLHPSPPSLPPPPSP